jgi:hypothetical protein
VKGQCATKISAVQAKPVANLQVVFIRRHFSQDAGIFYAFEFEDFPLNHMGLNEDPAHDLGVNSKLGERRAFVVLVGAPEPGEWRDGFDARNALDDGALPNGQEMGDGSLIMHDQAQGRAQALGWQRDFAQRHHKGYEQKKADGHAQNCKRRAPPIPKGVFEYETADGHYCQEGSNRPPILH